VQPDGQLVLPSAHAQAPLLHGDPVPQTVPHCPQLAGSVRVSTHAVPHNS
jgi:hypothetical protein